MVRSLVCVCTCVYECVWEPCVYAHMHVRGMYMPIMAVKTMYIISRIHAHTAQLIEFLFVFDTACDSRMKASFPH